MRSELFLICWHCIESSYFSQMLIKQIILLFECLINRLIDQMSTRIILIKGYVLHRLGFFVITVPKRRLVLSLGLFFTHCCGFQKLGRTFVWKRRHTERCLCWCSIWWFVTNSRSRANIAVRHSLLLARAVLQIIDTLRRGRFPRQFWSALVISVVYFLFHLLGPPAIWIQKGAMICIRGCRSCHFPQISISRIFFIRSLLPWLCLDVTFFILPWQTAIR